MKSGNIITTITNAWDENSPATNCWSSSVSVTYQDWGPYSPEAMIIHLKSFMAHYLWNHFMYFFIFYYYVVKMCFIDLITVEKFYISNEKPKKKTKEVSRRNSYIMVEILKWKWKNSISNLNPQKKISCTTYNPKSYHRIFTVKHYHL